MKRLYIVLIVVAFIGTVNCLPLTNTYPWAKSPEFCYSKTMGIPNDRSDLISFCKDAQSSGGYIDIITFVSIIVVFLIWFAIIGGLFGIHDDPKDRTSKLPIGGYGQQ